MANESKIMLRLTWALFALAFLALIVGALAIPTERVAWIAQHLPDLSFLTRRVVMPWPMFAGWILISLLFGDRTRLLFERATQRTRRAKAEAGAAQPREQHSFFSAPAPPGVNEIMVLTAIANSDYFELEKYARGIGVHRNQVEAWVAKLLKLGLVAEFDDVVYLTDNGKIYAEEKGLFGRPK